MLELSIIVGIIGGLFGTFYRDCLKVKNMILNWWYKILKRCVERKDESKIRGLIAWISYPLGYCIYCSTTWITIFLGIIVISDIDYYISWQDIVIFIISSLGVQHITVAIICRFIIDNHPDLNKTV